MARKKKPTNLEKAQPTKEVKADQQPEKDRGGIPEWEDRSKDWVGDKKVEEQLDSLYDKVVQGFDDKTDQNQVLERCWDVYNCELNENQAYEGDSKIYLPIVRDAIEARVTRFVNQLFPQTGRYSDVVSVDGTTPYEIMALLDHYVVATRLRDVIIPSLMRAGDIGGQYSLYLGWSSRNRHTIQKKAVPVLGPQETGAGAVPSAGEVDDVEMKEYSEDMPDVMVLDPRDLCVLPATVDEITDASVVAVALRLSESKVQEMIDDGTFNEEEGEMLLENFSMASRDQQPNPGKQNLSSAGVQVNAKGSKTALIYQVWTKLKIGGKRRMCVVYYAGKDLVLACRRNPNWNDRIPVLSRAALKVNGAFWGKSRVEAVEKSQYAANDAVNMAWDSAKRSLLPIVMSDPEKNPRSASMVLAMGAMWQCDPNSTQVMEFPQLWQSAVQLVELAEGQIMSSLSVNPSMIPQTNSGKKPSQAQIAQEQQVAMASTADVVTLLETGILNDLLEWFYDLDYQHRDEGIMVQQFGTSGQQAKMELIPPIQVGKHYEFRWYGTEGMKSAQQIQNQIAALNVIQNVPPEQLDGRRINAGPLLEQLALNAFGPNLAPKILIDQRHSLTMDPKLENEMMVEGFDVPVQPLDNDMEHIQAHQAAYMLTKDPTGFIRKHIMEHVKAATMKQATAQQGAAGAPPRPGAQPQAPMGGQNPPGLIHQDALSSPDRMPRMRQ